MMTQAIRKAEKAVKSAEQAIIDGHGSADDLYRARRTLGMLLVAEDRKRRPHIYDKRPRSRRPPLTDHEEGR